MRIGAEWRFRSLLRRPAQGTVLALWTGVMFALSKSGSAGGRVAPTPNARLIRRSRRLALGAALLILGASRSGLASDADQQSAFSHEALNARLPIVREEQYVVNARVRPLLLFWIGRDDIGSARITWRAGAGGRRGLEFLVGSDPARAPRQINRWGYIVEDLTGTAGDVLGLMKESTEETLAEAEANIKRAGEGYKAVRTTIDGRRAMSGTVTFSAPATLTYNDLQTLLSLMPVEGRARSRVDLPAATEAGFLTAMTSVIGDAVDSCRARAGSSPVRQLSYLYNQTVYDLSLVSCDHERVLKTTKGSFADVIDGRFQVRNRRTGNVTKFQVAFGASHDLRGVPVRIVFRPRWWMEVELVLDRRVEAAATRGASSAPGGRR